MPSISEPRRDGVIYLDNAATSWPKPESVYQAMDSFLRNKGGNPGRGGHSLALAASRMVEGARLLVARLINAPQNEQVIFTLNCTDALNLGLKGLLEAGDHVITSSIEHNSVVRPLTKLEKQGIRVTRLSPSPESGAVAAADIKKAITKKTKLIVMTHASNVSGVIQPITEYGAIARQHNLIFMVDAAQTAGVYPIDVQAANIDLLAFSGHKGMLGPPGTGVLYVGSRVGLDSLREGGTGSNSEQEEQPLTLPYKYESGTLNTVGIAGLGASLEFIAGEGIEKIRAHEQSLWKQLRDGLSQVRGVVLYAPDSGLEHVSILSLNLKRCEPGEAGAILDQAFDIKVRTGLHCAPAAHKTLGTFPLGTVRLSPGYFNTVADIELTLQALEKIATMKPAKDLTKTVSRKKTVTSVGRKEDCPPAWGIRRRVLSKKTGKIDDN
ncbi:MAG: aminotransferase class V-fold PLP-dependent enzyme [Dehalococcoidia bacterium]|nr:MAG: aminotransferase class V-fold PLP-dependent enzyme [Dehalococcoidia bacterium]